MVFDISSLIAVPVDFQPYPFPPIPIELIRCIFELAASHDIVTGYSILLISSDVRRWIHPIVYETIEIFGLRRLVDFEIIFAEQSLLATSVRNLALYDDTPGDILPSTSLFLDGSFFPRILILCRGVRRLAVNYIRGIPSVEGPQPYELTIRRCLSDRLFFSEKC